MIDLNINSKGLFDLPILTFYEQKEIDKYGRERIYPILISNLIQECYNKKNGFITNEIIA